MPNFLLSVLSAFVCILVSVNVVQAFKLNNHGISSTMKPFVSSLGLNRKKYESYGKIHPLFANENRQKITRESEGEFFESEVIIRFLFRLP